MGWYVETPGLTDKAEKIKKIYGAVELTRHDAEDKIDEGKGAVICVVKNASFEAAAFCYSPQEFRRFDYPGDSRPKTWLWVADRETIEQVSGFKAHEEKLDAN